MFNYLLSVAVAFIFYGTILNVVKKIEPSWYVKNGFDGVSGWVFVGCCSFAWFISLPVLAIILTLFVLKLLTDNIATIIINNVEKRKLKKQSKLEK